MCLLVLAWRIHPRYRLIVAANRDEYHDRPAEPLGPWPQPEGVLAGRDLRAGGTWLGIDRRRRFGVVTNFRERQSAPRGAASRGGLIPGYFAAADSAGGYLAALAPLAGRYGGFNLLLADAESLWYGSNRTEPFAQRLDPGVYGLSNHRLDTPWPKLTRVRGAFERWLAEAGAAQGPAAVFEMLDDRRAAEPQEGAAAGVCAASWERALSAPFLEHPEFGTRCSTVLFLEPDGALRMCERCFDRLGRPAGERDYRLGAHEWC